MKKSIFLALVMLVASMGVRINAQVTIGDAQAPQSYSVLELISNSAMGLRLPQMTTAERDAITTPTFQSDVQAHGLMIYNTTIDCVETWNSIDKEWVSLCGNAMLKLTPDVGNDPNCTPTFKADGTCTNGYEVTDPTCRTTGEYVFTWIAGEEFIDRLDITDPSAGRFSVSFTPNDRAFDRNAILLVNSPCGNSSTFVFTQAGIPCTDNITVSVATYSPSTVLCQGGAVHAYVQDADPAITYYWLRNGVEIAQGAGVELTQAGTYKVYATMIGCGTPGTITVTGPSGTAATRPSFIIADNNGILCGTNGVTLSALSAPSPATGIMWLKDGLLQGSDVASWYINSDPNNAGTWYLIYNDPNDCSSTSSNKIHIAYNPGSGSSLPDPDARVNGTSITVGALTICAGGTLELTVANTADYSTYNNVEFEWFGNGVSLGKTSSSTMYVVPPSATNLVISLTVTATDFCPMSKTSNEFVVITGNTPPATSINRGEARAYICANQPAVLTVDVTGSAYQWFRNGVELAANTNPLSVMQPGTYTVRYTNASGCWSTISTPIEVIQSAPVSISWAAAPATEEIFDSSRTYSVIVAPDANVIQWAPANPAYASIATITPLGNGTAAIFTFGNTEVTDYQIKVTATNACGSSELLSDLIHVKAGCIPAGSVVITPSAAQTMEQGQSITFTASANTGTAPISYRWFVDGIEQVGFGTTGTFVFTTNTPKAAPGYSIAARATASCAPTQEATSAPVQVVVTLNPNLFPDPDPTHEVAFFGGKSCLDVHATNGNASDNPWADGGRLPLSIRPNDFNNGSRLAFTYNFRGTGISNIRFMVEDQQNIIASVSGDANATSAMATVTFKDNIITLGTGLTKNTALSFTLYAVYDVGAQTFKERMVIKVQDQSCGCPARVSATTWQTFECHNPGADITIDPLNTANSVASLRGNYYVWGRKLPTRLRDNTQASPLPTTTRPGTGTAAWSEWENPCQYGWRVAVQDTWRNVWSNNTVTRPNTFLRFGNYLLLPPQGYYTGAASSFGNSLVDATGYHYWTGSAFGTIYGHNYYYSSTSWTGAPVWGNIEKNYQEPVRCVQEGTAFAEND
jgi:hypothetical protein